MPRLRRPRALRRGARIAIAAPAGPVEGERIDAGETMLRELGFEPVRRTDLVARRGYLAGDDARRAAELMEWIDSPRADAILCARGGYGCHRIVSMLDPERVRRAAKPLVGYSDVTTLLLWQRRVAGLVGFHGPMLERGAELGPGVADALGAALCGEAPRLRLEGRMMVAGGARGRLVGGSLSLVVASLGTPWEVDTRGAILLLEEVNEAPYAIDRMLAQLRAAGKLGAAAGIGLGAMVGCEDARYPRPTVEEVLCEILQPLGVPVVAELPFGHVARNLPWPLGARAEIDGERGTIELLEAGVSTRGARSR